MVSGFPIYDLGNDFPLWECPVSAVSPDLWDAINLFWLCYCRVPGQGGWLLQRTGYPEPGGVMEQDAWTMWTQLELERHFVIFQDELRQEQGRATELAAVHARIGNR